MGVLEQETKRKERISNIQAAVLKSVAVAGLLSVAILAPNILQVLKQFGVKPGKLFKHSIDRSVTRLTKAGLVCFEERDVGKFMRLTEKGRLKLKQIELMQYSFNRPRKWDGKWRIVIFDIKENRRNLRTRLREILSMIGFARLQNSVWVFPYDCEDVLTLIKSDLAVGKDILYIIADTIENDVPLKKAFNLLQLK